MKKREGEKLYWYRDSLGKWTGGVGHLRKKGDPDFFDQSISDAWLEVDLGGARKAAQKQFSQLPFQTQALYEALVSCNFQFGNDFDKDFPQTWELLKNGYYTRAIAAYKQTLWNRQTPTRVNDLVEALQHTINCWNQYKELV